MSLLTLYDPSSPVLTPDPVPTDFVLGTRWDHSGVLTVPTHTTITLLETTVEKGRRQINKEIVRENLLRPLRWGGPLTWEGGEGSSVADHTVSTSGRTSRDYCKRKTTDHFTPDTNHYPPFL